MPDSGGLFRGRRFGIFGDRPGSYETMDKRDYLPKYANRTPNAAESPGALLFGRVPGNSVFPPPSDEPRNQWACQNEGRRGGCCQGERLGNPPYVEFELLEVACHLLAVQITTANQLLLSLGKGFHFRCNHSWSFRNSLMVAEKGGVSSFMRFRPRKNAHTAPATYS